jgi:hypothetical protein
MGDESRMAKPLEEFFFWDLIMPGAQAAISEAAGKL